MRAPGALKGAAQDILHTDTRTKALMVYGLSQPWPLGAISTIRPNHSAGEHACNPY